MITLDWINQWKPLDAAAAAAAAVIIFFRSGSVVILTKLKENDEFSSSFCLLATSPARSVLTYSRINY